MDDDASVEITLISQQIMKQSATANLSWVGFNHENTYVMMAYLALVVIIVRLNYSKIRSKGVMIELLFLLCLMNK